MLDRNKVNDLWRASANYCAADERLDQTREDLAEAERKLEDDQTDLEGWEIAQLQSDAEEQQEKFKWRQVDLEEAEQALRDLLMKIDETE